MDFMATILQNSKTIAVVGLSDKKDRPSFVVASYLLAKGYVIFPVNPNLSDWRGIKAYKSLSEIKEKIDIVDIFRKSEDVLPIVQEAISLNPKPQTIWMQLSVINEEAAKIARNAGLNVIMDKCIKIEHSLQASQ
ncbi:MAG: CoA-binding protein [Candidatus Micrarchaeota archaeon]